jgi:hypothetical protein
MLHIGPRATAYGDRRDSAGPVGRARRDRVCPKAAVRAMPARLLLLCVLFRSSWLTVEGGRGRRRHSAASPGRTGSRGRVGRRGWWRSVATASGPVRRTPVFLGCKPPIRLLLVGQTSYLWSAGDTAFPPRATVLLRRPTPLVSRGRTDAVPPSVEAWEPSAFTPQHRIDRSSAQHALTLRPSCARASRGARGSCPPARVRGRDGRQQRRRGHCQLERRAAAHAREGGCLPLVAVNPKEDPGNLRMDSVPVVLASVNRGVSDQAAPRRCQPR